MSGPYPVGPDHPVLKALFWYLNLQKQITEHLDELEERIKKLEEQSTRMETE